MRSSGAGGRVDTGFAMSMWPRRADHLHQTSAAPWLDAAKAQVWRRPEGTRGADTGDTGPAADAEGIIEDLKGKAKEATGALTDNDSLRREGQAQQHKAGAQRDVATHEAEAEKARLSAKANEAEERNHPR